MYNQCFVVDCTWNEFSEWSVCSVTCGNGTATRMRTMNEAQYGGLDCVGESLETQWCKDKECPSKSVGTADVPPMYTVILFNLAIS